MRDLVLYGNHESGHSFKVRSFFTLAAVPHRYVWVDLDVPRAARPEEFRRVSQYGEVPVLVVDGVAQAQSNAILLSLARETGKFGPPPGSSWERLTTWMFWEANRIGFSMPNLRWYRRGFGSAPDEALAWIEARAVTDMDFLQQELGGRPWLAGASPTSPPRPTSSSPGKPGSIRRAGRRSRRGSTACAPCPAGWSSTR